MNDTIKASLEAIDAECENAAQAELDDLSKSMLGDGATFQPPSPQAVEAIWLRLVARKEQEFVQAVMDISPVSRISRPKPESVPKPVPESHPSGTDAALPGKEGKESESIEETINAAFADERYEKRMRAFFQKVAETASQYDASFQMDAKRLDLIDTTYRAGMRDALRRARQNILDELRLKQPVREGNTSLLSTWREYSTLSPGAALWTIVMLSLTSYLIAFIIASDAFRALLERFGWPSGGGM